MKKKILLLSALFLSVTTVGAFAFGLGLQLNGNAGKVFEPGVAITLKLDQCPLYFAGNYYIGDDSTSIGMTADYWALNDKLTSIGGANLNWFVGVGFFVNTVFAKDDFGINAGIRVPLGLNMLLANGVFEPFIQVAPSFGIKFLPSIGATTPFFPISAGFRIWFK